MRMESSAKPLGVKRMAALHALFDACIECLDDES